MVKVDLKSQVSRQEQGILYHIREVVFVNSLSEHK